MKAGGKLWILLILSGLMSNNGEGGFKKNIEIIHKGKSLEDLANSDSGLDSHDIALIKEAVQPKLIKEELNERLMLTQMGVDDMYPLDASVEAEKPPPKPIIATEDSSDQNDDGDQDAQTYTKEDFPEYNTETKADYSENKEAADWLIKHPSNYNARLGDDAEFVNFGSKFNGKPRKPSPFSDYDINDNYNAGANTWKPNLYSDSVSDGSHLGNGNVDDEANDINPTNIQYNDAKPSEDNDQNKDSNTDSSNFSESKETATDSTAEETDQSQRLNNDERNKNENSDGNNEKKLETGKNAKHHKQRVKVVGDLLIVNKGSDQSVHNKVHEFNDVQQDVSRVTPLSTKLDLMDPDDKTKNSKQDRNNETRPSLNQSEPHRRPSSGDSLNFMFEDGGDVVKVSSSNRTLLKLLHKIPSSQEQNKTENQSTLSKLAAHIQSIAQMLPYLEKAGGNTLELSKPLKPKTKESTPEAVVTSQHGSGDVTTVVTSQHGGQSKETSALSDVLEPELKALGPSQQKGELRKLSSGPPALKTAASKISENSDNTALVTQQKTPNLAVLKEIKQTENVSRFSPLSFSSRRPLPNKNYTISIPQFLNTKLPEERFDRNSKQGVNLGTSSQQPRMKSVVGKLVDNSKPDTEVLRTQDVAEKQGQSLHRETSEENESVSLKLLIGDQLNQMQKMMKNYQILMLKQSALKTQRGFTRYQAPLPLRAGQAVGELVKPIPIEDKTYSSWNEWSQCSVTCGTGAMARARVCRSTACRKSEMYETKACDRDICPDDWQRQCLEEQNKLRAKHHVQPLKWSQALAERAQKLANELAIKQSLSPSDLEEEKGESVAQLWRGTQDAAKKSTHMWYDEIKSYSFSYPEVTSQNHHFVQLVWKGAKEFGMARAKSPYGDYSFVVALYYPPGVNSRTLTKNVFRQGRGKGVDVYSTFRRQNISRGPQKRTYQRILRRRNLSIQQKETQSMKPSFK